MRIQVRTLFKSLKFKLIFGFLLTTLPLIALLFLNNKYAILVVRNQVAQSNMDMIHMYMRLIDRNLEDVDQYLYNFASLEKDLLNLEFSEKEHDQEYVAAKIRLLNKLSADINKYKIIDTLFIFSTPNQDLLTTGIPGNSYQDRELIRNYLSTILHDPIKSNNYKYNQWFVFPTDHGYYLYRLVKSGGITIGAWLNANALLNSLSDGVLVRDREAKILLATENGESMTEKDFVQANEINLQYVPSSYARTGAKRPYLMVGEKSSNGNFNLIRLMPESTILEKLPYLQWVVSLISVGALGMLAGYLVFMRRVILAPINRLVHAMRSIKNGNLASRIEKDTVTQEFGLVHETFNGMMDEIKQLKISIYEEKLEHQRAELKHLQLQINPHFFLNSLNIIFHLANAKDFALIQELTRCLVQYFRFMFRSNLDFVALADELGHTRNYLRIQELRFPGNLTFGIKVQDSALKAKVPPLVIQTFVENAIKHAITMNDAVQIHIKVELDYSEGVPKISMVIQDTGVGFPADVLLDLQRGKELEHDQGEHIGIWNVQRRLRLLYEDQADIVFSNGENSGATVRLSLPFVQDA